MITSKIHGIIILNVPMSSIIHNASVFYSDTSELKSSFKCTGNQCNSLRTGVIESNFRVRVITLAAACMLNNMQLVDRGCWQAI